MRSFRRREFHAAPARSRFAPDLGKIGWGAALLSACLLVDATDAATYHLQSGQTVWDTTSNVWDVPANLWFGVAWVPGNDAQIDDPNVTVTLDGPQTANVTDVVAGGRLAGSPLTTTYLLTHGGSTAVQIDCPISNPDSIFLGGTAPIIVSNSVGAGYYFDVLSGTTILSGTGAVLSSAGVAAGDSSATAPVTLRVEAGADVVDTGGVDLVHRGVLEVTGSGSTLSTTGHLWLGSQAGATSSMSILAGGAVSCGGSFSVADTSGSNASATVTGTGSCLHSDGVCYVGYAGTTTTLIASGGVLDLARNLSLATTSTANATLLIGNGGTLVVADYAGADGISKGAGTAAFQMDGASVLKVRAGETLTSSVPIAMPARANIDTNGGNAVLSGVLSGRGFNKLGDGILKLTGANTYTGFSGLGTVILGGLIEFSDPGNFGTFAIQPGGGGIRWAPGNTYDISSRLYPFLAGGAIFDTNGNNVTLATALSGSDGITKTGLGILKLYASNSYFGPTLVRGGLLEFGSITSLGDPSFPVTLDGGGLRWINSWTTDVSSRLSPLGPGGGTFDTNGNNLTHGAPLTGTGGFTKLGDGTLTLTGNNSYLGNTVVDGGTLSLVGAENRLSATPQIVVGSTGTATLSVTSGATLGVPSLVALGVGPSSTGTLFLGATTLNLPGNLSVGAGGTGTMNIPAGTVVTTGGWTAFGDYSTGTGTVSGPGATLGAGSILYLGYQGSGSLTVDGGGVVAANEVYFGTLAGSAGTLSINAGGTLQVGGAGGIHQGAGSASFSLSSGTLRVAGSDLSSGVAVALAGSPTIDTNGLSATLSGTISGSGSLTKVGAGTLVLGAANSYGGGTTISAGTVIADVASRLGTGPVAIGSGGQLSGSNFEFARTVTLDGSGSNILTSDYLETGSGGPGSLSVTNGGVVSVGTRYNIAYYAGDVGTTTVSGIGSAISAGTLFRIGIGGDGTVTVGNGASISAGQLILGVNAGSSGTLHLQAGSTLAVGGVDGILVGGGSASFGLEGGQIRVTGSDLVSSTPMALSNASVIDTNGRNATLTGALTGSGSLEKVGSGSLVLSGANAYSGRTTITNGTLGLTGSARIGDASDVYLSSSATLDLAFAGDDTVNAFRIDGVQQATGTWGAIGSGADHESALITGTGRLLVTQPPYTVTVTNPANASGSTGVAFSETFSQVGGQGTVVFALQSGSLPTGLTLSTAGVLSGTPTQSGSFPITVRATDDQGTFGVGPTYALSIGDADATLSSLVVSEGTLVPDFAPSTTTYSNTVANAVSSLTVTATTSRSGSTLKIAGLPETSGAPSSPISLSQGSNPIDVEVTAPDGVTVKTYSIDVTRLASLVLAGGGLTLVEEGGSFAPSNLAAASAGAVPFAYDVIPGYPQHTIPHLNDGTYGNSNSWIGNSAGSFAGINLGATAVVVDHVAFGRDATGAVVDRSLGLYTLQYTTTPNPDASTSSWNSIGTLDYVSAGAAPFAFPSQRHLYSFTPVAATGIRIITAADGTAIDEIEVYAPPVVGATPESQSLGQPLLIRKNGGAPANLDLTWGDSCGTAQSDFAVYEGTLGGWYSHASIYCSTIGGFSVSSLVPGGAATYYLVVPLSAVSFDLEGSYGKDSSGVEIPRGTGVCRTGSATIACP